MRLLLAVVVGAALFAGCGGSGDPESEEPPASSSTTPEVGLAEACPRLQSTLAGVDDFASPDVLTSALAEVDEIETTGDAEVDAVAAEVRTALEVNLEQAQNGWPDGEGLDAFAALTDAGEAVAEACP